MNNDDFEKRLRQQPLRTPPTEWRERILDSARASESQPACAQAETQLTWWRALLWPSPQAWAGLAAVWVILLVMNRGGEKKVVMSAGRVPSPVQQIADARRERNHLFAELINETPFDDVGEVAKPLIPVPRSEAPRLLVCV